jgi:hypothetical protein
MNALGYPTKENLQQLFDQLPRARDLLREQGRAALENPHAAIGRICGCKACFCCAALMVLREEGAA